MLRTKLTAALFIWAFVLLVVALAVPLAPSGQIALVLKNKTYFTIVVLLPQLFLFVWAFFMFTQESELVQERSATNAISGLVVYSLYVVILTGGITGSPLSSLVGIVPLFASPFLNQSSRMRLLVMYLFGVIIVGGLSHLSAFIPPEKYPSVGGWETTGHANNIIAMGVMSFAILIEIKLITLKQAMKQSAVAV